MPILDAFVENIQMLPCYMKRHLRLIFDLDKRVEDINKDIENDSRKLLDNFGQMSSEEKTQVYKQIIAGHDKAIDYSGEKRVIGDQIYNQIDKYIRQLDDIIVHLEAERTESEELGITASSSNQKPKKRKITQNSKEKTKKPRTSESSVVLEATPVEEGKSDQMMLNMEVDPNEPLYCVCNQVSFGEMIACDDNDCPYEWFHFQCVGLNCKPKGKWFCPTCSQKKHHKK